MRLIAGKQMMAGLFLYGIHYWLIKTEPGYCTTHFRNYFGDFLALIVFIPVIINVQLFLGIRKLALVTVTDVLFFTLVFSIWFEVIAPRYFVKCTGDIIDACAYFIGGSILYLSQFRAYPQIIPRLAQPNKRNRKTSLTTRH
jgi:predicted neutral ceramidase superfamily lipid hydrolase